jgi:hypothetical protein
MNAKANPAELVATWTLPYEARLGSSVRSKGLYMQVRSHLPKSTQKSLTVKAGELTLRMPRDAAAEFAAACAIVAKALVGIETRPVIPREIEDILGITSTERRRWLEDGRLPSAGTRTIKLRGRGTITFHVFDPVFVAGALSSDLVVEWREQDAEAAAERRLKASWKAKRKRLQSAEGVRADSEPDDEEGPGLIGWDEFAKTGLP